MKTSCEPGRDIPVIDEADVVVVGGGPNVSLCEMVP